MTDATATAVEEKELTEDEQAKEEESFLAYMDGSLDGMKEMLPTPEEELEYLQARLKEVRTTFKILVNNKREFEGKKDDDGITQITKAMRDNWNSHKYIVKELHKAGVKVDHPFGILS